jgi:hypothetical protein
MLCGYCHGRGLVRHDGGLGPCLECGGFGVLHCCEGLQAQCVGPEVGIPVRHPGEKNAAAQESDRRRPPGTGMLPGGGGRR